MMTPRFFLRVLPLAALAVLASPVRGKELDGVYKPVETECPTVEQAIAKMKVPAGYEVRNFAAEPMVVNPVAMSWDHRGRLWVVELYEYPLGTKTPNEYQKAATDGKFRPVVKTDASSPRDRVVVLEDTDNDGKADKRTVFVEGLSLATGIACGYDGVFVGQAPNLFYFRDSKGTGKADEYKTVLTGFGLEDRHELLNSLSWGPDGAMYFTHGVFTHSKVRRPGEAEDKGNTLNAGIYKVKFARDTDGSPVVASHEIFADGTSNPWGVDFNTRGHAFVEACVIDHLFHMAPGGLYQRQGGAPENPYAYELLPSIVNHKHFRAAYAGIQIYQGGMYAPDTAGHAFFGNIHDNSIHEESLTPEGATYKAAPVRDFLRAEDGWFRPVSIQTGPDGFLWVMDWCDKYPCYQNAQANPEGVDRERGRIWRICYKGSEEGKKRTKESRPVKDADYSKLPAKTLASAACSSGNSWSRRMAFRMLVENGLGDARELLEQVAEGHAEEAGAKRAREAMKKKGITVPEPAEIQAEALRILEASGELTETFLTGPWLSLNDDVENLRTTLRFQLFRDGRVKDRKAFGTTLERMGGGVKGSIQEADTYAQGIRSLTSSSLTLPRTRDWKKDAPGAADMMFELLNSIKAPGDRTLWFHIWQAYEPILATDPERGLLLADLVKDNPAIAPSFIYKMARRVTDTREAANMDLLLAWLERVKNLDVFTAHALDGMLKAQEAGVLKPAKTDPAPLFAHWKNSMDANVRDRAGRLATLWGDPNAVAAIMGTVLDAKAELGQRVEGVRTVRRLKSDAARAGMLKLLDTPGTPDTLTVEVMRAAGELGGLDLANAILKAWEGYPPALRTAAAEVLVTREDWASRLLDAVEGKWVASGKINASEIPASARRSLAANAGLKPRAEGLLGVWNESSADVKKLIAAKRKAALTGDPDLAMGRQIFATTCATCHKFHGGGQEVGPELIGSGRSSLDALLNNVIDPNQIIGNGYENFTVTTTDGRTLAGRVIEDTPTQMTLLGIGGVRAVVPRAEIKDAVNTRQSLMPMGFGELPDEAFRDLVWYILAPPEEGPLTKEKKDALATPVTSPADAAVNTTPPAPKPKGDGVPRGAKVDMESVSLWNPDWKVTAAEFEGTPAKLPEYEGRKNVLMMHPSEDRKTPAKLTREMDLPADKAVKLKFATASHAEGDWKLVVTVNGKEAKTMDINRTGEVWKTVEIDLTPWQGQKAAISIENHATGWMYEFSYWADLKVE